MMSLLKIADVRYYCKDKGIVRNKRCQLGVWLLLSYGCFLFDGKSFENRGSLFIQGLARCLAHM